MMGSATSITIEVRSTIEMVKLISFLSPLMAPPAAMAAETPQMETALAIMLAKLWLNPTFVASQ